MNVMTELNYKKVGIRHIRPFTIILSPDDHNYWAFNLTPVETQKMVATYSDPLCMPVPVGVSSKPTKAARQLLVLLLEDDRERFGVV